MDGDHLERGGSWRPFWLVAGVLAALVVLDAALPGPDVPPLLWLVAVVLGEQSRATRRVRATDLLENGFKRYFWKSLFGTSIDGLAIQQASLTDGPPHLKDAICGVAKPKPSGTRKVSRKGGSKKRSTVSIGAN